MAARCVQSMCCRRRAIRYTCRSMRRITFSACSHSKQYVVVSSTISPKMRFSRSKNQPLHRIPPPWKQTHTHARSVTVDRAGDAAQPARRCPSLRPCHHVRDIKVAQPQHLLLGSPVQDRNAVARYRNGDLFGQLARAVVLFVPQPATVSLYRTHTHTRTAIPNRKRSSRTRT